MDDNAWDNIKFKVHSDENGWLYLETEDHKWLSLSYAGWLFRSSNKDVGWKIIEGKLYNNYSRWKDYPAGARYIDNVFDVWANYVGVNLADDEILTNCVLITD